LALILLDHPGREHGRERHRASKDGESATGWVLTDSGQQGESSLLVDFFCDLGNPA
jgi:hypothetical protein